MKKMILSLLLVAFQVITHAQSTNFSALMTTEMADHLATLPLHCIVKEWPNKTSHLSDTSTDHVLLPHQLHPAFYGCLDWHSSVHGHWMLIKLLKKFPALKERNTIISVLNNSFRPEKIEGEAKYFSAYKTSHSYERTYGWAWLLKLDQELGQSNDTLLQRWHTIITPLTNKIVTLWKTYLPKATYPDRTGVHPNSAFGLVFALDWARFAKDTAFEKLIIKRSKDYYLNNKQTPAYLEPNGSDFLSPSLEIADLMRRVLPTKEFINWFNNFYTKEGILNLTKKPVVSDRTDYFIVHLDGLALSRAWCMKGIASVLPAQHPYRSLFIETAKKFILATLPTVTSGNYGGDHWLGSFATYAMLD